MNDVLKVEGCKETTPDIGIVISFDDILPAIGKPTIT